MRVAVIGAGKVGSALAAALASQGMPVEGPLGRAPWPNAPLVDADVVIIAVPDAAIADVAAALHEGACLRRGVVVLHTAGALGETALAHLGPHAHAGTFHPLQSFASRELPPPLAGVPFALAGDDEAVRVGCVLANGLGGLALVVREETRALYHSAAVLACGHASILAHAAARALAAAAGVSDGDALALLAPIARATQSNLERMGFPAAMTGPVARHDAATLARHSAALLALDPRLATLYDALTRAAND